MDLSAFARALAADNSTLRVIMGVVVSIQAYSVTVTINGSTSQISAVKYASSVAPRVGAAVYMITDGSDLWIISQLAPVSLPKPLATRSTVQSIATSTWTPIIFDAATDDGWGMWSNAHPTRLTCVVPGRYMAIGTVGFASSGVNARLVVVTMNGGGGSGYIAVVSVSGVEDQVQHIKPSFTMAVGDYVELSTWQNSGGALNTSTPTANVTPSLSLIYLG